MVGTRARHGKPAAPAERREDRATRDERISGMKLVELKNYARENDIYFKSNDKKAVVLQKIRDHLDAADEEEGPESENGEDTEQEREPLADVKMSVAEITKIAEENGVDLAGVKGKRAMVAAIETQVAEQPEVSVDPEESSGLSSPEDSGSAVTDDHEARRKGPEAFAKREEVVGARERRVEEREEEYLRSREAAVEERERAIREKEDRFARKRSLSEADPGIDPDGPRPTKRRRIALENERAAELESDLPRPEVPEFLERKGDMKLQRGGRDFKTNKGKDVKQWYEDGLILGYREDNERWLYKKGVGEGAYGSCSIWIRANEKLITDRVVLKDQIIDEHSLNWLMWTFDAFQEKPLEADLQKRLWERNPRCFLGYRGFSYDKDDHVFRLYTEYARYGSLKGLIEKYATPSRSSVTKGECIPEPFIWYVARELLLAAKTMATGYRSTGATTENEGEEKEWMEIVHMDIKPQNILMAEPDPETEDDFARIYQWPKIQLTDFGVTVELRSQWQNPQDLTGRGTPGYMAPEQHRQVGRDPDNYPIQKFSSKTNIWGIGAVLYDLMNPRSSKGKDDGTGGPIREADSEEPGSRIGYHKDLVFDADRKLLWRDMAADGNKYTGRSRPADIEFTNVYSEPLNELVTQCLSFKPEDRMDLEDLESSIEENLDDWNHSQDEDWSGNDKLDFESKILRWDWRTLAKHDEFAVGQYR